MWGGLDLSAIGGAMGEALKNASSDLEKGVSNALGIDPTAGEDPDAWPTMGGLGAMHAWW